MDGDSFLLILEICHFTLLAFVIFEERFTVIFILVLLSARWFVSSKFLQGFSLCFNFVPFESLMPGCIYFGMFMVGVLWAFWVCVYVYMSLVWENSQLLLLQYFFCMLFPLFSFSYSHYTYITPFVTFSQFLDSPYCLFALFSLWISYLEVSIDNYSSSLMLSLVMSSLLVSPPEAFFIFVMYVWSLAFPFDSFLDFPFLCLNYLKFTFSWICVTYVHKGIAWYISSFLL